MQRCRIRYYIPGSLTFNVQAGEEETAEDLVIALQEGRAPAWLKSQVVSGLRIKEVEVEEVSMSGDEPDSDEELNFDEPCVKRIVMEDGILHGDDIDDVDWE